MTFAELNEMTVLQLRKLARENKIVLGAGVDKATMIHKIVAGLAGKGIPVDMPDAALPEAAPPQESAPKEEQLSFAVEEAAPTEGSEADRTAEEMEETAEDASDAADWENAPEIAAEEAPVRAEKADAPAQEEAEGEKDSVGEPRFQAAWHSPDSPHFGGHPPRPSGGTFAGARPAWQNTTPSGRTYLNDPRHIARSNFQAPRFGPGSSTRREPAEAPASTDAPVIRPAVSPLPEHRVGFSGNGSFGPRSASVVPSEPADTAEVPTPETADEPVRPAVDAPVPETPDEASGTPTLEELISSGEFEEGSGILELHPDGYGFLRAANFLPSSRDIYVSMAQIRRFGLRTGDEIRGKIRPQREGDKYAALLYIDTVNGVEESEAFPRPLFEELTPVYPSRRISLEFTDQPSLPDMRLIDLIAPLGFGQRGLLLCPPDTGKLELLKHYAHVFTTNYPDLSILMLLIDLTPEDVTLIREEVPCPVLASTFDQSPEAHLRLTEMVMERAMRLVEQKKDVIILADSLTRLAKIYTTAAAQQGRSVPGMVNPASLLRAKKLFGAARAIKEGGSLTVIAAMDVATGSRVDDAVVEEFKGTANMELMLDQSVARAGVSPAINLQRSFTKNSDQLLNPRQKEGLALIRQMLGTTSSVVAIPQLLSMMEKAGTNSDLLLKMKDWFALMNRAK